MSYPDGNPAGSWATGAGGYGSPAPGPGGYGAPAPGSYGSPAPGPGAGGWATGAAGPQPVPQWQQSGPAGGGYLRSGQGAGPLGQPVSPPQPLAKPAGRADPARLLGLAVAVLGALNFCFGFLPEVTAPRLGETLSVFAVGPAYVPILLLIAGLLALAAFLPGSERSRLAVAAVSVGGAVGAIVSLGTPGSYELFANPNQVTAGLGAILLVVFGIVQAVVAIGAYVVGSDAPWSAARVASGLSSTDAPGAPASFPAAPTGYPAGRYGSPVAPTGTQNVPAGYPAASPAVFGSNPTGQPDPGWTPLSAPPRGWPQQGESATGPQVVVGTEAARPEQPARDTLSTSDTGPIAVVQEPPPADNGPVSLSKRDGSD